MATIEQPETGIDRNRVALIALGAVAAIIAVVLWWNLGSPPQMGADEEVFRTVDALFTAVTGKNEKQLDDCERRLKGYREAGKLPAGAAKTLDSIIGTARKGQWQPAAERLYAFMQGQRREGSASVAKKS